MRSEQWQRALRQLGLPLALYTLAAVIMTWPLVARLTTHAAGTGYSDSYEVTRHVWWAREQIMGGHNPFDQPLLVYPEGFTSWLQWAQPLQYFPPALLALVVSPLTAFNLVLLITLVLNGLAAYALGLAINGGRRAAALLGGLAFMSFPALQGHLSVGHLGIVMVWAAPLFARCLWRVLHDGAGWRTVAWGGLWFAVTVLSLVTQIVYVLVPLVVFLPLGLWLAFPRVVIWHGTPWRDQPWLRALAMVALGGLLILPFYLPLLTGAGQSEISAVREAGRVAFSTDPLAFVSPSPFGPLEDAGLVPDYTRQVLGTNSAEGTAFLGAIALALAGLALLRRRAAWPWAVLALGAMILSLGPLLKWQDAPLTLTIEDVETHITLPWAFLENLPVLDATRTPGRFNLATGVALSALVSLGAAVLLRRAERPAWRYAAAGVLAALVLVEYQLFWPFPTVDADQPDYFQTLAEAPDVRAVLNVPADNLLVAKTALYQQTIHGKPLIAGQAGRRSPQDPAVLALLSRGLLGDEAGDFTALHPEDAPALLAAAGADLVIAHKAFLDRPESQLAWLAAGLGAPVYEDAQIAVFAVPVGDDLPADALALVPGYDGWSGPAKAGGQRVMFLAASGAWHLYSPSDQFGELVFQVAPYRVARPLEVWLDDHLLAAWPSALASPKDPIRLPLWLDAGFHTLRFVAPEGCTDYPFALACWDESALSPRCEPLDPPACISVAFGAPAWVAAPAPPVESDAQWAEGLRLRGYTLDVTQRRLDLRLFWMAEGALPANYALFVHVADPQTGQPLAQFDGYPAISTDAWPDGTAWVSEVTIVLPEDLPAGEYAINVGWALVEEGTRLPLESPPGDVLRLTTMDYAPLE